MPSIMTLLGSEHSVLIRSKFRSVLQLRLQQRRTREQLADQGIMPPLKSPAAFHEQRKSLERSKTGDYLKHKIRSRPDKSALVKMRILPDPAASEGSATPREAPNPNHKLKRARLADDLNEKLALRPGPLELVQKNIIPADCSVKEAAMRVNHGSKFPKQPPPQQQQQQQQQPAPHHQEDSYAFEEEEEEEDSSSCNESLSPPPRPLEHETLPHPHSDESHGSTTTTTAPACPSCPPTAADAKGGGGGGGGGGDGGGGGGGSMSPSMSAMGAGSAGGLGDSAASLIGPAQGCIKTEAISQEEIGLESGNSNQATPPIPVPAIVKPPKMSDKNRHKKPKDIKPKVRKLKYHQYIPPDQKAEKSPPPMDSAYARLLQQQQLFLQLQILSQQKHQHHHQHHHQHQQQQQQHSQCSQAQQHQQQTQQQQQQQQQVQQTQSFSYQPLHQQQANRPHGEQMSTCGSGTPTGAVGTSSSASSPVKTSYISPPTINPTKLGPLPPNLDDLKVSELRQQLRIRGMPVSGTKTALIERLRPFRDPSGSSPGSQASDITTVTFPVTPTGSMSSYQSPGSAGPMSHGGGGGVGGGGGGGGGFFPFCSTGSTPPISPASSELSGSLPDSFSDVTMSSPQFGLHASSSSPGHLSADEGGLAMGLGGGGGTSGGSNGDPSGEGGSGLDAEKDKMLVEKQKVIEELTWKLHQEQRQVEELRMQLHKRKRSHGGLQDQPLPPPPPPPPPHHHHHLHPHPTYPSGPQQPAATGPQHPSSQGQNGPMAPHHHGGHQQHQHQHQQSPHGLHMHPNNSSSSSNSSSHQMQHNFYGNVSVKQEHVTSSCPLASKAMKNNNNSNGGHQNGGNGNGGSCMEGMGAHCGMMGAPQRCPGDVVPPSRSPSSSGVVGGGLSAFLSPQCSPQDSPGGNKTSGSPQPSSLSSSSSPSHSYMMTPPMGRDGGCSHSQTGTRPRNMQIQQKAVSQPISCPYPPDQRGLQALYPPSPADMGLNERPSAKAKNNHMQTKIAVSHSSSSSSPRHPGHKCPVTSSSSSSSTTSSSTTTTAFCSSESDCAASKIKQPPCYEDAVKQQLTRSQQMDEILDVLIESGEMPAISKDESSCSCVTKVNVPPHLAVSAAVGSVTGVTAGVHSKFHRHYGHMVSPPPPPPQMPFEPHGLSHTGVECHLDSLLSNPMVRQGDIVLLKLGEEGTSGEDIVGIGGEHAGGFVGAAASHHDDKMLVHRDMMDTPLSPMATKVSPVPGDGAQGLGMAFAESPWETMEWLDLTPPSSATAFNSMATAVPSIFNTEFLDVTDINLNSAMDLHLEHW